MDLSTKADLLWINDRLLQQRRKERSAEYSQHTGDDDGQAAHCAFNLTKLQRLRGANGMRRRADCDAAGDGFRDAEDSADIFCNDIAKNTGDEDDSDGDGDVTAKLFADAHAYGCGDGLG